MRYFSNESVKLIVSKVLYHLPYYKRYPHQLITEDGLGVLRIGKEQDPNGVTSPLKILSCSNQGALNVAEELVQACKGEYLHVVQILYSLLLVCHHFLKG